MKIKVLYRRSLKMNKKRVAQEVAEAITGLTQVYPVTNPSIKVDSCSDKVAGTVLTQQIGCTKYGFVKIDHDIDEVTCMAFFDHPMEDVLDAMDKNAEVTKQRYDAISAEQKDLRSKGCSRSDHRDSNVEIGQVFIIAAD